MGISMFPSPSDAKRCACGAIIDSSGCNQAQNLRTKRHNALCDVLFNALLVDDSRCRREMRCASTSEARPGDIFHPDFELGLIYIIKHKNLKIYMFQEASYKIKNLQILFMRRAIVSRNSLTRSLAWLMYRNCNANSIYLEFGNLFAVSYKGLQTLVS